MFGGIREGLKRRGGVIKGGFGAGKPWDVPDSIPYRGMPAAATLRMPHHPPGGTSAPFAINILEYKLGPD
jgi:hypothetical protein